MFKNRIKNFVARFFAHQIKQKAEELYAVRAASVKIMTVSYDIRMDNDHYKIDQFRELSIEQGLKKMAAKLAPLMKQTVTEEEGGVRIYLEMDFVKPADRL